MNIELCRQQKIGNKVIHTVGFHLYKILEIQANIHSDRMQTSDWMYTNVKTFQIGH